jgi:hypothetical protein
LAIGAPERSRTVPSILPVGKRWQVAVQRSAAAKVSAARAAWGISSPVVRDVRTPLNIATATTALIKADLTAPSADALSISTWETLMTTRIIFNRQEYDSPSGVAVRSYWYLSSASPR